MPALQICSVPLTDCDNATNSTYFHNSQEDSNTHATQATVRRTGCAADVGHAVDGMYGSGGTCHDGAGRRRSNSDGSSCGRNRCRSSAAAPASDLKIGLVTDVGRVNDRSFNQSAWEGVKQAGTALGLTEGDGFKYIETQDAKEYADNIQQFVDAGYNVIVTVGFALGEATAKAAAENPDIYFIGVDQFQGDALPNLTGLVFHEDQAGFLAGALAAQLEQDAAPLPPCWAPTWCRRSSPSARAMRMAPSTSTLTSR